MAKKKKEEPYYGYIHLPADIEDGGYELDDLGHEMTVTLRVRIVGYGYDDQTKERELELKVLGWVE